MSDPLTSNLTISTVGAPDAEKADQKPAPDQLSNGAMEDVSGVHSHDEDEANRSDVCRLFLSICSVGFYLSERFRKFQCPAAKKN